MNAAVVETRPSRSKRRRRPTGLAGDSPAARELAGSVASATPQPGPAPPSLDDAQGFPGAVWAKIVLALGLGALAVALVPQGWEGEGAAPPVAALLSTGAVVGVVTAVALWWALRRDLGFPARVALYAVAFHALVVLVKFVLAPHGLYEVNREVPLDSLFNLDDWVGAGIAAVVVFGLYALAYVLAYQIAVGARGPGGGRIARGVRGAVTPRRLAIAAATVLLVLGGLGGVLVLVLIPVLLVDTGLEYIDFVFASSVSALVAVLLAGATGLAIVAFRAAAASPAVVADAALLASFFWVGLAFLALYHALWVVYILVLTALWPLRVVVPK